MAKTSEEKCPCGCGWDPANCNNPATEQGRKNLQEVAEILKDDTDIGDN